MQHSDLHAMPHRCDLSSVFHYETESLTATTTTSPTIPWPGTTGLADVSSVHYTRTMVRKTYKDWPIRYNLAMWSKKQTPYSSSFNNSAPESGRVDGVSSLIRGPPASLETAHLWEVGWPGCGFQIHICRTRCDTVVQVIQWSYIAHQQLPSWYSLLHLWSAIVFTIMILVNR